MHIESTTETKFSRPRSHETIVISHKIAISCVS